jgi:type I restriction enzyme R subunit
LEGRETAKAFYGIVNEILDRLMEAPDEAKRAAAEAALEIDLIIETNKVIDWANNLDAQNEMRNQIDDYLYSLKEGRRLNLNFDDMDRIIDQSLSIARARRR